MSTETPGVRPADALLDFSRAAPGPRVEAPTRFAGALKRARYARGWTQARLAKEVGLPERTVASWERGARMPGAGIVSILGDLLSRGNAAASGALMAAYLADDLEAEERRAAETYPRFAAHARRVRDQLAAAEEARGALVETTPAAPEEPTTVVHTTTEPARPLSEPLFALLASLQEHPDLIPVATDFVREMASSA